MGLSVSSQVYKEISKIDDVILEKQFFLTTTRTQIRRLESELRGGWDEEVRLTPNERMALERRKNFMSKSLESTQELINIYLEARTRMERLKDWDDLNRVKYQLDRISLQIAADTREMENKFVSTVTMLRDNHQLLLEEYLPVEEELEDEMEEPLPEKDLEN